MPSTTKCSVWSRRSTDLRMRSQSCRNSGIANAFGQSSAASQTAVDGPGSTSSIRQAHRTRIQKPAPRVIGPQFLDTPSPSSNGPGHEPEERSRSVPVNTPRSPVTSRGEIRLSAAAQRCRQRFGQKRVSGSHCDRTVVNSSIVDVPGTITENAARTRFLVDSSG